MMNKKTLFSLLSLSVVMILAGHLSTFMAGKSLGYSPEIVPFVRNILIILMLFLVGVYFVFQRYRGDYSLFVTMFLLIGIGLTVQYGIESRERSYKKIVTTSGTEPKEEQQAEIEAETLITMVVVDSLAVNYVEDLVLISEGPGPEETAESRLSVGGIISDFAENRPVWQRLFFQYGLAFAGMIFIVMVFSRDPNVLIRRYYLWALLTIVSFAIFAILSSSGKYGGMFFYGMTPWEFYKISFVVILAGYFSENREAFQRFKTLLPIPPIIALGPLLVIYFIPLSFLLFLKDFGQLLLYAVFVIILLYAVTKRFSYLFFSLAAIGILTAIILIAGDYLPGSFNHIYRRFATFIDFWNGFPAAAESLTRMEQNPEYVLWRRQTWQTLNGFFAVNAGGIFGTGIGFGMPTLVPLVANDFVYAAIAEEWGIIGSALVLGLYLMLILSGVKIAGRTSSDFLRFLVYGFTIMFTLQVIINIGGVINLLPMTGVTLPFLSKGGFSLMTNIWIVGFLMAISHYVEINRKEEY
ncbi:FtsW/RodA/SpoVE family cell cycle protein [candidate division KSB1 bacterium]